MLLVIDNYDSFAWNLVHRIGEVCPGLDILVVRNDEVSVGEIGTFRPAGIVISPGPCSPAEAGVSVEAVRVFGGRVPILGVCLGHQCIAAASGMRVVRGRRPVHGKTSIVHHDGRGVFEAVASPFTAARYHSLVAREEDVPDGWTLSAWTEEDGGRTVMGLRREWGEGEGAVLEGVQFHPESFMTPAGHGVLAGFLRLAGVGGR